MAQQTESLTFQVHRHAPELIAPASPTPHEFKPLSDIDDQDGLRFHLPIIQFYSYDPSMQGKDPVMVIREALAKTLVFYYPLAGRIREGANRKLIVECTGEGVLFIEADADVRLEQFGDPIHPPFPCLDELLFNVPGSDSLLNAPLLLIQVTRLRCGGLIIALRFNHTIFDGQGLCQFLGAMGEMARGTHSPSISPVWERHVLSARNPPHPTFPHHEYQVVENPRSTIIPFNDVIARVFYFGSTDISRLRKLLPSHLSKISTFDVLTACLWRCRTVALRPDPKEEMHMRCIVNVRNRMNPPLPEGFYGNVLAFPVAVATAGELAVKPFGYAVEMIKKAKEGITKEYMQSVADLMVIKGRPPLIFLPGTFFVSDIRHLGTEDVDFGWGKALYIGPAKDQCPNFLSFYIPSRKKNGEKGILVPIVLPAIAMETFEKLLGSMLDKEPSSGDTNTKFIRSGL